MKAKLQTSRYQNDRESGSKKNPLIKAVGTQPAQERCPEGASGADGTRLLKPCFSDDFTQTLWCYKWFFRMLFCMLGFGLALVQTLLFLHTLCWKYITLFKNYSTDIQSYEITQVLVNIQNLQFWRALLNTMSIFAFELNVFCIMWWLWV